MSTSKMKPNKTKRENGDVEVYFKNQYSNAIELIKLNTYGKLWCQTEKQSLFSENDIFLYDIYHHVYSNVNLAQIS